MNAMVVYFWEVCTFVILPTFSLIQSSVPGWDHEEWWAVEMFPPCCQAGVVQTAGVPQYNRLRYSILKQCFLPALVFENDS